MTENSKTTPINNMNEHIILITMKIKQTLKLREIKSYIEESLEKVVTLVENWAKDSSTIEIVKFDRIIRYETFKNIDQ